MSTSLLDVRGIGQASADILVKQGFKSAEDLAAAEIAQLIVVQGFNELRAAKVIKDAQALLAMTDITATAHIGEENKAEVDTQPLKKGKKNKDKKSKASKSVKNQDEKKIKSKKDKKSKKNNKKSKQKKQPKKHQ